MDNDFWYDYFNEQQTQDMLGDVFCDPSCWNDTTIWFNPLLINDEYQECWLNGYNQSSNNDYTDNDGNF